MRTCIPLLTLALFSVAAMAQADTKILSVRYGEIIRESSQYKTAETKMKAEFEKRGADIEAQRKAFAEDYKNYQRDADTLSADQRLKKEKDLKSRDADLTYAQRKFQEDLQARDRELTQEMVGKIDVTIAQVAKEKAADLVIKDALVINPTSDITAEVLKRLNAGGAGAK